MWTPPWKNAKSGTRGVCIKKPEKGKSGDSLGSIHPTKNRRSLTLFCQPQGSRWRYPCRNCCSMFWPWSGSRTRIGKVARVQAGRFRFSFSGSVSRSTHPTWRFRHSLFATDLGWRGPNWNPGQDRSRWLFHAGHLPVVKCDTNSAQLILGHPEVIKQTGLIQGSPWGRDNESRADLSEEWIWGRQLKRGGSADHRLPIERKAEA